MESGADRRDGEARRQWSKRGRVGPVLAIVLAPLGLATPVPGDSGNVAEPAYEIGRIVARGGNPIRGTVDGVIFDQRFGPACVRLENVPPQPFSGSLGRDVELDIEIHSCSPDAPAPAVRCSWSIGEDAPVQTVEWKGSRDSFAVEMPPLTGDVFLELACDLPDRTERFEFPLFVTLAPPRTEVLLPKRRWYELAARFGADFAADAEELDVVRAIELGMYGYGQEHWRYGYCHPEDRLCVFPPIALPCDSERLFCSLGRCQPDSVCKCFWDEMLEPELGCHFADCFAFVEILRYLSATMGIGGLVEKEIFGAFGRGFATAPELGSLDPGFGGNLLCGSRELPCSYLFDVHDLAMRDDRFFDPTFGTVYRDPNEAVGTSVADTEGLDVIFEGDDEVACFVAADVYDSWFFYRREPWDGEPPIPCPRDDTEPAEILAAGQLEIVEIAGRPRLAVDVEIEVFRPERYFVVGQLYQNDEPIDLTTAARFQAAPVVTLVESEPGRAVARLYFSGQQLIAAGVDRGEPVILRTALISAIGLVQRQDFERSIPAGQLLALARFAGPDTVRAEGVDPDDDGRFGALRLRGTVEMATAGRYALDVRLSSGGRTIVYAGRTFELEPGRHELELRFPGAEIARRGVDGEYRVTLELHHLGQRPEPVDELIVPIGPFRADAFR